MRSIHLITLFILCTLSLSCPCKNKGVCIENSTFNCECPINFIGEYCQFPSYSLDNQTTQLVPISFNNTYFTLDFYESKRHKFHLHICMMHNPRQLQNLLYVTTQNDDGSFTTSPFFLREKNINLTQEKCLTFTTDYIGIEKFQKRPRKVIFGMRAIIPSIKNYFHYRFLGKPFDKSHFNYPDPSTQKISASQQILINVTYDTYVQGTLEIIISMIVKILIFFSACSLSFIFFRITVICCEINAQKILVCLLKTSKKILTTIVPSLQTAVKYKQYFMNICVNDQISTSRDQSCSICLQPFQMHELVRQTGCNHVFHMDCLDDWKTHHTSCPMCRTDLSLGKKSFFSRILD